MFTPEQKQEAGFSALVAVVALACVLIAQSCKFESPYDPAPIELQVSRTAVEALSLASAKASTLEGAKLCAIYNTGSMAPLMDRDGFVVVLPVPYDQIEKHQMLWADSYWGGTYVHVAVEKDAGGWITSGLANKRSDTGWRVTPARYHGVVISYFSYGELVVHPFESRPH